MGIVIPSSIGAIWLGIICKMQVGITQVPWLWSDDSLPPKDVHMRPTSTRSATDDSLSFLETRNSKQPFLDIAATYTQRRTRAKFECP